jgi:hypothetical protein
MNIGIRQVENVLGAMFNQILLLYCFTLVLSFQTVFACGTRHTNLCSCIAASLFVDYTINVNTAEGFDEHVDVAKNVNAGY